MPLAVFGDAYILGSYCKKFAVKLERTAPPPPPTPPPTTTNHLAQRPAPDQTGGFADACCETTGLSNNNLLAKRHFFA